MTDDVRDWLYQFASEDEEIIQLDGLEDAVIGVVSGFGRGPVLLYSTQKILDILVERDGMSYEEAQEFFDFNIAGLWAGPGTPMFSVVP